MNTLGCLSLLTEMEYFKERYAGQHWFVPFLTALAPPQGIPLPKSN